MSAARVVQPVSKASSRRVTSLAGRSSTASSSMSFYQTLQQQTQPQDTTKTKTARQQIPSRPFHASARSMAFSFSAKTTKPKTTPATTAKATTATKASTPPPAPPVEDPMVAAAGSTIPPPSSDPIPEAPTTTLEAAAEAAYATNSPTVDWSSSFHGLSTTPFPAHVASKLMTPLDPEDVEIKPDGIIYLPEIKYRRILNSAFGPGGWGLAPRGELAVGDKVVSREYALVVQGRFVGVARGECGYFGDDGVATAGEGCKSNALMRCCKDLGVASELWDPRFIRSFKAKHCREVWVEHVTTKKRRLIWLRKDCPPVYPYTAQSTVKK